MSIHNICSCGEIRKILDTHLIFINSYMMMWSSAYYFEVTVHIFPELCPLKVFVNFTQHIV